VPEIEAELLANADGPVMRLRSSAWVSNQLDDPPLRVGMRFDEVPPQTGSASGIDRVPAPDDRISVER
jgi:hypothetical protein